ncbi:MAG: serine/threonine-protein kinase, partial [Gemmatimonadota bacterium]|nr:serine/threonine-protein kinase [Gemmatimonadota bacterium]
MTLERLRAALADRYRIERELGQGGMATVYLAEDLKHDRKVALKVLRPELAAVIGAERFVVEIKTTAALQHPHILPLFDSGAARLSHPERSEGPPDFLYYVMPFIDGETLRSKLDRETQLGIDEAVKITVAVADALDYAHRQGVIHRDIKPENILLHDGRPMVADFGIALALSAAAGGRMTETGMSLGTPHYMSPEQATAEKELSARSDIYSLGSVLYEMLTGNPPHTGASAQQIIMKIVTEEAQPVTKLRKSVPPNVAAAVAKAIHKLPADRFDTARAFAEALGDPNFSMGATGLAAAHMERAALSPADRWKRVGLGAGLVAAGVLIGLVLTGRKPMEPEVVRFTFETGPGNRLAVDRFEDVPFALSPDGRSIVFVGQDSGGRGTRLFLRAMDQLAPTPIQGTEDAVAPFFSPDGLWVGFATESDEKLKKVPVGGGPAITLASDVQNGHASASWGDDGFIVYASAGFGLSRVSGSGGQSELASDTSTSDEGIFWPQVLPGGRGVLAQHCRNRCAQHDLTLLDLDTRQLTVLVEGATRGWYLPTGYLLYATQEGALYAAPFDLGKRAITGAAVPLLDNVRSGISNATRLAVSPAGTIAYLGGAANAGDLVVAQVDRAGREEVLISRAGSYDLPRLSPEGERIGLVIPVENRNQIWVYDIPSATLSQLTFEGTNSRPSWSPDGTRLVFASDRSGNWDLWWAPADGSGPGERVAEGPDVTSAMVTSWSRDGKWIVFDGVAEGDSGVAVQEDVFAVPTTGKRIRQLAVGTPADEQSGVVSPDGRWIAYNSDESGTTQVYVRPFLV